MTETPIRVLLVDDSPVALAVLSKLLSTSTSIKVVGTARNGKEALDLIPVLDPAVICTDLEMPVMNGLELTQAVMAHYPRPILVVSSLVQERDAENVFRLLDAGAIDVLPKPRAGMRDDDPFLAAELVGKIKVLSGVVAFRRKRPSADAAWTGREKAKPPRIVAVGASMGGPQALKALLGSLPKTFPVPVLCVQHIGTGFLPSLLEWLRRSSMLKMQIIRPGECPEPGVIHFPQEDTHLTMDQSGRFVSSSGAPVSGHRPSITVTFKSVAQYYGASAAGVLLTGMGDDGAEGLKAIVDAGGLTIAQDEFTSVVFGMPRQAIKIGAARCVLPVGRIAPTLIEAIGRS